MTATVISFDLPNNARLVKILVAAKLAGVEARVQSLTMGTPSQIHPIGRAPVIETPEGNVFESNSCMRYMARAGTKKDLYGSNAMEATQIDMWLDYAVSEGVDKAGGLHLHAAFFNRPHDEAEVKLVEKTLDEALWGLDRWLEVRTFLVGERISIADINMAFSLDWTFRFCPDHSVYTKKFKNVFRFYNTIMQQPEVVEVLKANKYDIGLPKPGSNKAAEKKTEEKKVNAPAPAPAVALKNPTAAPLIANFKKFAGDKSAYFMFINLEYTNDVCNFICGPEGFSPEDILAMLTNPKECGKLQDAYCKIAKTSEKKMEKTREEIANLVNDFMDKKVGGVKELKEAEVKEKKAVDPETAALIAEFEAFVATQTQKHTTPKMFALVMDYLPEGFHPADIKTMLTDGEDCDELLETYVRLAVVPSADKLRVRNELVAFVEAFAESKGIVHEEMCF